MIISLTVVLLAAVGIAYGSVYGWRQMSVVFGIGVGVGAVYGFVAVLKRVRRP